MVADNLNKISRLWGSFGPKIGPIRTCRVSGKGHDQVQHVTYMVKIYQFYGDKLSTELDTPTEHILTSTDIWNIEWLYITS